MGTSVIASNGRICNAAAAAAEYRKSNGASLCVSFEPHYMARGTHLLHVYKYGVPTLCPRHLSGHLLILFLENSISHFYGSNPSCVTAHRTSGQMKNVSQYYGISFLPEFIVRVGLIEWKNMQTKANHCPRKQSNCCWIINRGSQAIWSSTFPHTHTHTVRFVIALRRTILSVRFILLFLREKKRFSIVIIWLWFAG